MSKKVKEIKKIKLSSAAANALYPNMKSTLNRATKKNRMKI